jgi:hypothetical protein
MLICKKAVRPSISIAGAALVLAFGSIALPLVGSWFLIGAISGYLKWRVPFPDFLSAPGLFVFALPFGFSLLGLMTAVGLMRLQEWARRAAIFLSVAPILGCALMVSFHPLSVFPPSPGPLFAGLGLWLYQTLLVILTPVSVWWLLLFTRVSVKAQFQ